MKTVASGFFAGVVTTLAAAVAAYSYVAPSYFGDMSDTLAESIAAELRASQIEAQEASAAATPTGGFCPASCYDLPKEPHRYSHPRSARSRLGEPQQRPTDPAVEDRIRGRVSPASLRAPMREREREFSVENGTARDGSSCLVIRLAESPDSPPVQMIPPGCQNS